MMNMLSLQGIIQITISIIVSITICQRIQIVLLVYRSYVVNLIMLLLCSLIK
nr:MAG TPA: hypothetical protein [Bacteriophage sp.]